MYWLMIAATPKPETEVREGVKGSFISCWIDFQLQDGAELLARHYIDEAGWTVEAVEDVLYTERSYYEDKPELKYFLEAEADGASFVFHTYENEDV